MAITNREDFKNYCLRNKYTKWYFSIIDNAIIRDWSKKTTEHKEKIKNALVGVKHTTERRLNMSINCPKNSLGKKWYHNTTTKQQRYFIQGQQPEGFVLGRG